MKPLNLLLGVEKQPSPGQVSATKLNVAIAARYPPLSSLMQLQRQQEIRINKCVCKLKQASLQLKRALAASRHLSRKLMSATWEREKKIESRYSVHSTLSAHWMMMMQCPARMDTASSYIQAVYVCWCVVVVQLSVWFITEADMCIN